jgi:hypothetical protein
MHEVRVELGKILRNLVSISNLHCCLLSYWLNFSAPCRLIKDSARNVPSVAPLLTGHASSTLQAVSALWLFLKVYREPLDAAQMV